MEILRGLEARPARPRPAVVTVGKFTLVHRGHRALLERVCREAGELGAVPAVVTFDRDPLETIAPQRAPGCLLATLEQRLEQLAEVGVERALVLEFTERVAMLEPEEFVRLALVEAQGARRVIVGEDFRFGRGRRGDIPLLERLGAVHGFDVAAVPLVRADSEKVSSSTIRELVRAGRVEEAAELIGHPYRLAGRVVAGAGRAAALGYPTANVQPHPRACLPAPGIYAGRWRWRGRELAGVVSVGTEPTFGDAQGVKVEIHILDFEEDLRGEEGEVVFVSRLRDERRFDSVEALVEQIGRDAAEARRKLGG